MAKEIRLGLIGAGIARSLAPRLHEHLGRLHGLPVRYTLFDAAGVPAFDPLALCRERAARGDLGLNVTRPFKQVLRGAVKVEDPRIARIGSINSIRFDPRGWIGTNTDYTGFLRAYRQRFGESAPGAVLIAGAGGVGRAVAFALAELGAARLRLWDLDGKLAADLAAAVQAATGVPAAAVTAGALREAVQAAAGLVNCTPVGMNGAPGEAFPADALRGKGWAFDAVYTPTWTPFLAAAQAAGLAVLTGFELFFYQGLDAFRFFTEKDTAPEAVRDTVSAWLNESAPEAENARRA